MGSRKRSRGAGFSYIEVLVGIVILAIVAGGIAQGLAQTSHALGTSKLETTANKLASAVLDRAHRMPYADLGTVGGSPPGVLPASQTQTVAGVNYQLTTDVQYVDDPALGQPQTYVNYKKVTVTVQPQGSGTRAYTQTTIVAPPAIGAIAGKATIVARVIDAMTDQPVAGAPVTVDGSTSPAQTRSTAADGTVVFAGLEPSAISPSDPKYKYRVTVGLQAPWVTHPDDVPTEMHLAASQSVSPTIRVFKQATIIANVTDAATGQPVTERTQVQVTTPSPNSLSDSLIGNTGSFTFTSITGKPIMPSASNFTVAVQADCYRDASAAKPVPSGYPANTTETFSFPMSRVPSGYLDVTVRSTASGNPLLANAQVQVSGGDAKLAPRVRNTDASGTVRFCLDPSGSSSYVVSAAKPGYGAGSVLADVAVNGTTPVTLYLPPASSTGAIRLVASASGKLVRLRAVVGTYDASQYTNTGAFADFTGLAAGNYIAYIATGFSGGTPVWSSGKNIQAIANQTTSYTVP